MFGADLLRVTDLDAPILAAASSPPIRWQWRRVGRVVAVWLGVRSGLPAHLGGLELEIAIKGDQHAGDGSVPRRLNGMVASGGVNNWYPLGVDVQARDPWALRIFNTGVATIEPRVFFVVE